ncbi:hypothetical protein F2Q68_00043224 [Brassica cretica]|uniref:Uncharacterized protein n=1 Tax=Brassica cretica TaxID=69181 RepID=A0A8S9LTU1_BRACR|nr:hypothetical protein F2Q68_00043224 [Brassica cretica]
MTIGTRTNQARSLRYYRTCMLSGRYSVLAEAQSLRSDRARAEAWSLAFVLLGRYVATELEPKPGRNVATERSFCSIATQRPSSSETSIQH